MKIEIEAKFLHIDKEVIRDKLKSLQAKEVRIETAMKRKNFDYPDKRLEQKGGWVRLRDEGDAITLAYKQLNDRSFTGTQEVQTVVENFEDTEGVLLAIGLVVTSFQETKRSSWEYKGVQIEIDEWPWIPTLLEIEGESEEIVKEVASDLGLNWDEALHGSVEIAYMDVFEIEEVQFYDLDTVTFESKPPEWLEKTRRQKK